LKNGDSKAPPITPVRRLARFRELKASGLLPISRDEVRREVLAGTFPLPVRIGSRSLAWYVDEIQEWIASRPRVKPTSRA
jgi:predicted DNA-binding transcriptional regulator AlpA